MDAKSLHYIAKVWYAMEQKAKKPDVASLLKNERYQRTFTDEYLFARKPTAREPIMAEVRQHWAKIWKIWGGR